MELRIHENCVFVLPVNNSGLARRLLGPHDTLPCVLILTLWSFKKHHEAAIQQLKHHEAVRVRVKIGICGLHYHPSNPFLFHGFFQQSLFFFWNFQFFITLFQHIVSNENPADLAIRGSTALEISKCSLWPFMAWAGRILLANVGWCKSGYWKIQG